MKSHLSTSLNVCQGDSRLSIRDLFMPVNLVLRYSDLDVSSSDNAREHPVRVLGVRMSTSAGGWSGSDRQEHCYGGGIILFVRSLVAIFVK